MVATVDRTGAAGKDINAKIVLSVSALENLSDNGMGMAITSVHTNLSQEH